MNYRTVNFPGGATFYTTWTLFEADKEEARRREPMRTSMLTPEELDNAILCSQACSLFNAECRSVQ